MCVFFPKRVLTFGTRSNLKLQIDHADAVLVADNQNDSVGKSGVHSDRTKGIWNE